MVGGLGGQDRIVVVDDDDDMRQSVREFLEGEGYAVESAANALLATVNSLCRGRSMAPGRLQS
jgi:CheY-like chemotaxis protein